MFRAVLVLLALAVATAAFAQSRPPACTSAEHRQFDFWIGEWEVTGAQGKVVGNNRITREFGGCALHERYDTGRGYSGASYNAWDGARRQWHQTWVDTGGQVLKLDGGLVDGKMVLEGESPGPGGRAIRQRITWTPNPDGTVRQLWESTNAAGEWTVAFDGLYRRK